MYVAQDRLWESFECPYRVGPRLLEMGPLHMLPREGEEGVAHTLESSLYHNRARREIDLIGERLCDSELLEPMPTGATPEWPQAHTSRAHVGRQFLEELREYKMRVLESKKLHPIDCQVDVLRLREYETYRILRCGRFITTSKLLASALTQAGLLELAEETDSLIVGVRKFESLPSVADNETGKINRRGQLQKATGYLGLASASFGYGQGLIDRCFYTH